MRTYRVLLQKARAKDIALVIQVCESGDSIRGGRCLNRLTQCRSWEQGDKTQPINQSFSEPGPESAVLGAISVSSARQVRSMSTPYGGQVTLLGVGDGGCVVGNGRRFQVTGGGGKGFMRLRSHFSQMQYTKEGEEVCIVRGRCGVVVEENEGVVQRGRLARGCRCGRTSRLLRVYHGRRKQDSR